MVSKNNSSSNKVGCQCGNKKTYHETFTVWPVVTMTNKTNNHTSEHKTTMGNKTDGPSKPKNLTVDNKTVESF